jgi:hypothetical protein
MAVRNIFLGKPLHWLPWPLLGVLFVWMNKVHLHVTRFNTFAFVLLGLSAGVVAFFVLTTRRGEQVTREPIPEQDGSQGTGSED